MMANNCVITTKEDFENDGTGVYLHWNGGRDSVEAFLKYCESLNIPSNDKSVSYAALCQVCGNYLNGINEGLKMMFINNPPKMFLVGVDKLSNLNCESLDNGIYIIDNWKIVDRKFFDKEERYAHDLEEMIAEINSKQPKSIQECFKYR